MSYLPEKLEWCSGLACQSLVLKTGVQILSRAVLFLGLRDTTLVLERLFVSVYILS